MYSKSVLKYLTSVNSGRNREGQLHGAGGQQPSAALWTHKGDEIASYV